MERLTEKQSAGYDLKALNGEWCNHYCHKQRVETCNECGIWEAIQKLAYYEDLEEQGRLVVMPCKEGTTIYQTCYKCICTLGHAHLHNTCHSPIECTKCRAVKIERWIRETTFCLSLLDRIGVDFFVNREEAETALKNI